MENCKCSARMSLMFWCFSRYKNVVFICLVWVGPHLHIFAAVAEGDLVPTCVLTVSTCSYRFVIKFVIILYFIMNCIWYALGGYSQYECVVHTKGAHRKKYFILFQQGPKSLWICYILFCLLFIISVLFLIYFKMQN